MRSGNTKGNQLVVRCWDWGVKYVRGPYRIGCRSDSETFGMASGVSWVHQAGVRIDLVHGVLVTTA